MEQAKRLNSELKNSNQKLKMKNITQELENSLLRLPGISPELENYIKGWEVSLKNFQDLVKEEQFQKCKFPLEKLQKV